MPLKSNTCNLFNSATLNKMKKGAVLVCDFVYALLVQCALYLCDGAQECQFGPTGVDALDVHSENTSLACR